MIGEKNFEKILEKLHGCHGNIWMPIVMELYKCGNENFQKSAFDPN